MPQGVKMPQNHDEVISYAELEMFLRGKKSELSEEEVVEEETVMEDITTSAVIDVDAPEEVVDEESPIEELGSFTFVVTELEDADDYGVTCSFAEAMIHNE